MSRLKLKVDLHLHNSEDILERNTGTKGMPTPKEFIDLAIEKGFDAIAFTHHGLQYHDPKITEYAKSKGLLLIPGVETFINKKHVLLLNFSMKKYVLTFDTLRKIKNEKMLVIAPHPYYKAVFCLEDDLEENIDCFDAIEFSHFYTKWFNLNKKAVKIAQEKQMPIVGNSDAHFSHQFGTTYSYVYAEEKSIEGIIHAIKEGQVEYESTPLPFLRLAWISVWALFKLPYWTKTFIQKIALKYNITPYHIRQFKQLLLSPFTFPGRAARPALVPTRAIAHKKF